MIPIRMVCPDPWLVRAAPQCGSRRKSRLLGGRLAELLEELVPAAAHVVHGLLGAGIEGVRFARGVELVQRQLPAVVGLAHFLGLRAGARHELEAVGQVDEQDVAVSGMDALLHGFSLRSLRQPRQTVWRTCRRKALNYMGFGPTLSRSAA